MVVSIVLLCTHHYSDVQVNHTYNITYLFFLKDLCSVWDTELVKVFSLNLIKPMEWWRHEDNLVWGGGVTVPWPGMGASPWQCVCVCVCVCVCYYQCTAIRFWYCFVYGSYFIACHFPNMKTNIWEECWTQQVYPLSFLDFQTAFFSLLNFLIM